MCAMRSNQIERALARMRKAEEDAELAREEEERQEREAEEASRRCVVYSSLHAKFLNFRTPATDNRNVGRIHGHGRGISWTRSSWKEVPAPL